MGFEWRAPSECPQRDAIVERVAEHTGLEGAVAPESPVLLEVRHEDETWVLRIEEAGSAPRELPGRTCDELADVAALVVAVALSQPSESVPPPLQQGSDTELPPYASRTPDRLVPVSTPEPQTRRVVAALWLEGGAAFAVTGAPAGLLGVGAGLRSRWVSANLGARGAPRTRVHRDDVGVQTALWVAELAVCPNWSSPGVELSVCGVGLAGGMRARGIGAVDARTVVEGWAAFGGRVGLRARMTDTLWFSLAGGPLAVLQRPQLRIDGVGVLCCSSRVGADISAGLEVRFGIVRNAQ